VSGSDAEVEVAIIGAGFAGLGMGARLLERGTRAFVIFEADEGVGGTWRANTYPGCACDVPSQLYSFSFAPSAEWSHDYGRQPEILAYLERFTDARGLRPHLRLKTRVDRAIWDEAGGRWRLEASDGTTTTARYLVAGTGPLRIPKSPDLPGLDAFGGPVVHTARWDPELDARGRRVAVIGTGASAIQVIPELAKAAEHLTVYQRTPPWVIPRRDGPVPERKKRWLRSVPLLGWLMRAGLYLTHELLGTALFSQPRLGRLAERRARRHLEAQVPDPALREKLTPNYRIGCKRVLLSNDYYPALSQAHVEVVDRGVTAVRPGEIVAEDGTRRPADILVLATGFEVTQFMAPLEVHGRGGVRLADRWADGAEAHLGVTVPDFPNLFILLGPNTGLGHNSVVFMIEAQIHYVLRLLEKARRAGLERIAVRAETLRAFTAELERRLQKTVWNAGGCRSWYLDENGRNVFLWPGYTVEYWLRTRRPKLRDFEPAPRPLPGDREATPALPE
jgi:cation diffusion facilitator CzcD-associated flavoprotein CzcO